MSTQIGFSDEFISRVNRLSGSDVKRAWAAVDRFREDPDHPSLNFHPVHGDAARRLHSFRASQDLRVLVARQGNVYVLLDADHHDELYERSRRLRFIANPTTGFVGLVDLGTDETKEASARARAREEGPGIFDHWADSDLLEAGFSQDDVQALRSCRSEDELTATELDESSMLLAIELLELTPEQWRSPGLDPAAEAEERFRQAIVEHGALAGISPLFSPEEIARIAAAPIEEWMVFLHPDQRSVVTRRYEGPARVRGSAGTGKTVVALHRAAELARRFDAEESGGLPILFTTFIRTLPPVLEQLYLRLPDALPGRVEFLNVDRLANQMCRSAGDAPTLDPKAVDAAFASACNRVLKPETPLADAGFTRHYLRDEITAVVKGRGVRTVDEYLGMERTGRGTRLPQALRRQVWDLRVEWDRQMTERNTLDFVDVVIRARDHARRRSTSMYRAAIVDEAQDLNLVGLQLIRALVNGPEAKDRPDGLLLVGDGAQRIYPGGFTLRQAGIEVRGRTTVLRTNYRNRPEIAAAAMAIAGDQAVDDLGEEYKRGEATSDAARPASNFKPILVSCDGVGDEARFIAEWISDLVGAGSVAYGDIAVCAPTNHHVDEVRTHLQGASIPTQPLEKYDGTPTDRVKVGTHHRAKGLEFKVVFLPCLGEGDFPRQRRAGQSDEEHAEETSRSLSQLFVAMTRARDALLLLATGGPSSALANGIDHFEVVDS